MSLPNPGRELFNGGSERERGLSSLTDLHWDETPFRPYDAQLGRFWGIDRLADQEGQESWTPMHFGFNNPVMLNDPTGLCTTCPQGAEAAKLYAVGAVVTNKTGSWTWTGSEWKTNPVAQLSERDVASFMPVNIAFGMGAYAGMKQTGEFLSSLGTAQGWKDLGQGVVNMARMATAVQTLDPEALAMNVQMVEAVSTYVAGIPDMTAGQAAYDLGYGAEKVAEAILTRRITPAITTRLSNLPRIKLLRGSGGKVNGFTISKGKNYGAVERFDVHPLKHASKKSNTMTIPKFLQRPDGSSVPLPHYHKGKGMNLHRHRPWEKGHADKSFWDRWF
jgi:hypothetical protein